MSQPGFWDDSEQAQKAIAERKAVGNLVEEFEYMETRAGEAMGLLELVEDDDGQELLPEIEREAEDLAARLERYRMTVLLDGPYDRGDAILSIHPGAGGTESQDWADMMLRMYTRWAEGRGYEVETLDYLPGDEAGIKSVTLGVRGENAYGFLKPEKGVHRLVRISPFDSSGRRHTSFASVDVLPDLQDQEEMEIRPDDIRVDVFRASGAGGQHVNKTSSAIRITHLPTGIVVQCQSERSQHSNRATALKLLRAKLAQLQEEQREQEIRSLRGEQGDIAWGNQIRSYVLQPYSLVKDHRTGEEVGNVQAVLDGDLDRFIMAYLRSIHGVANGGGR